MAGNEKMTAANSDRKTTLEVGKVISEKWVILEFIARGGMGEVYRAHQLNLKRDVALKFLFVSDERQEARMLREARLAASCGHPNLVEVIDSGSGLICTLHFRVFGYSSTHDMIVDTVSIPPALRMGFMDITGTEYTPEFKAGILHVNGFDQPQ